MRATILTLVAGLVVGCEDRPLWVSDPNNPQNVIVEAAIRSELMKLTGQLTKADLEKVATLYFNSTKLSNKGLKEVTKLKQLKILYLAGTKISDAGLKEIAKLRQLNDLDLDGTKVTEKGVGELKNALPKCYISY